MVYIFFWSSSIIFFAHRLGRVSGPVHFICRTDGPITARVSLCCESTRIWSAEVVNISYNAEAELLLFIIIICLFFVCVSLSRSLCHAGGARKGSLPKNITLIKLYVLHVSRCIVCIACRSHSILIDFIKIFLNPFMSLQLDNPPDHL